MQEPTERLGEVQESTWAHAGGVRRDSEPHRARLLLVLANVSCCSAVTGLFLFVPALVGLPVGIVASLMARRDLALMDAGRMDPRGAGASAKAWDRATVGTCFNLVALVSWFVLYYHFRGKTSF